MGRKSAFTQEELNFITANAALRDEEAAKLLGEAVGRTIKVNTYRAARRKLGLRKKQGRKPVAIQPK